MLIGKSFVVACMLLGLTGTFIHRLPGTPLIFLAALIYNMVMGFSTANIPWMGVLLALTLIAELGSRFLRDRLTPETGIDKVFGLDVAAGSFASLILADILAGPTLGMILWEILIGKSIMPLLKRSGMLVLTLWAAAGVRFAIAVVMMIIVVLKVL